MIAPPSAPEPVRAVHRGGADLHMHTTASDGTLTPAAMVADAHAAGLEAIAITDHDTAAGITEAVRTGEQLGLAVVPGVELSCAVGQREVHILGYLCDFGDGPLAALLARLRQERRARAERSVAQLTAAGYPVDLERVLALGGESVGRPHVARVLIEAGHVSSMREAFDRFLTRGRPGYAPRPKLEPAAAIQTIRAAGGLPVIAHPGLIGDDDLVTAFLQAGALGLECWHSDHSHAQAEKYRHWAERAGLLLTGGSDSHGEKGARPVAPGHVRVNLAAVAALRAAAGRTERNGRPGPPVY